MPTPTTRLVRTLAAATALAAVAFTPVPTTTAESEPTQPVPGTTWTFLDADGDRVFAVSDSFPQRNGLDAGLDVRTNAAQGYTSSDGGATWVPVLVPGDTDVDGVAIVDRGRSSDYYVANGDLITTPNGFYWNAVRGFEAPTGTRVHAPVVEDDGAVWATVRPENPCAYDAYEVRHLPAGADDVTSLPLPDVEGLAAWEVVPGPDDHVVLLVRYPYVLNDHDCYVGDAPGGQFLSRDGGRTWTELQVGGAAEQAAWVGDHLVLGIREDDDRDAGHLGLYADLTSTDPEVLPQLTARVRVPGDAQPVPGLNYGAAVHGLAADGADVVVHTGLQLLRYRPTAAGLGTATVEADLTTGTGLLWNAASDRPVAVTPAGLVARDLQALVLVL